MVHPASSERCATNFKTITFFGSRAANFKGKDSHSRPAFIQNYQGSGFEQ